MPADRVVGANAELLFWPLRLDWLHPAAMPCSSWQGNAENALIAEFQKVDSAFWVSKSNNPGSFQVDGLNVSGIDRLELQVDSVSKDPNTPYLITHNTWADGPAASVSTPLTGLLATAEHWGLLTA